MTRTQRKNQIKGRIAATTLVLTASIAIVSAISTRQNTYAIASENNGLHYKYVTEYTQKVTYIGKGFFVDTNGNEWKVYDTNYKKGKQYTITFHDNGTENNIKDDVIVDVY